MRFESLAERLSVSANVRAAAGGATRSYSLLSRAAHPSDNASGQPVHRKHDGFSSLQERPIAPWLYPPLLLLVRLDRRVTVSFECRRKLPVSRIGQRRG